MLYAKWMEELDKLDTPAVKERRYKDYWYLLELCGTFIPWKPKIWIFYLLYVILVLLNLIGFLLCYMVTIFKVNDLAIIGQALNYAALILIGLFIMATGNLDRRSMTGAFETCNSGFYDYKDEEALPDNIRELMNQFALLKKIIMFAVPSYMFVIAVIILSADQIDMLFKQEISNDTYLNGVYLKLPIKMWIFFKIETNFDWLLMLAWQAFNATHLGMVITAATLFVTFLGLELILQQNIIQSACLNMDKRADAMYRKLYGKRPPTQPLKRSGDRALMKCYQYCLKQVVEHHRILLSFAEKYMSLINWPAGIVVINGSISVAMSAMAFIQGGGKPSMVATGTSLLLAEVLCIFIICELGQTIKDLSEDIFDAVYAFNWMNCSKSVLKDVLIMKNVLNRPIVLVAGSLTPLNRDTFNTIMSTAYSYLNVLRAKQEEASND